MDDNVVFIDDFINKSDKSFEKQINDKKQRAFVARQKMLELCARRLNEADMNAILGNTLDDEQLAKIANGLDVEVKDLKDIAMAKYQMLLSNKDNEKDIVDSKSVDEVSSNDVDNDRQFDSDFDSKTAIMNDNGLSDVQNDFIDNSNVDSGIKEVKEKLDGSTQTEDYSINNGLDNNKDSVSETLKSEERKKPKFLGKASDALKGIINSSGAKAKALKALIILAGVAVLSLTNPLLLIGGAAVFAGREFQSGAKGK